MEMGPFLSTQPCATHQIHTQPNPTHFMLLADQTQAIKLVLLWLVFSNTKY